MVSVDGDTGSMGGSYMGGGEEGGGAEEEEGDMEAPEGYS